jgi:hypothetical protein
LVLSVIFVIHSYLPIVFLSAILLSTLVALLGPLRRKLILPPFRLLVAVCPVSQARELLAGLGF